MTFRVEEEEEEEEVQEGTVEEPTNPRIGVGANLHMMRNTRTGMLPRQLAPVQDLKSPKKMRLGGTMIIVNTRRKPRIGILLVILQETMRIGKGPEVLAQEERDIVGETEAMIGRVVEEIIMMIAESIEVTTVPVEGSTAQIGRPEGSTAQIDRTEGTTAPDTGKEAVDPEIGGTILQKRAEGTLAITDEVVAKGPLVMEGP